MELLFVVSSPVWLFLMFHFTDRLAAFLFFFFQGANSELSMRGSIRARFCPASNKLLSANIVYDTGAVHAQLPELTDVQSDAAARAASHQADAILDSLQMPHLDKSLGSSVAVVPQSGDSSDEGL